MGILYIVPTPIGNRQDITVRAIQTLFTVDIIACEDTRRTGLFLTYLQETYQDTLIPPKRKRPQLLSYFEENEDSRAREIVGLLQEGKTVALVSNAGTPLLSDPGFPLIILCQKYHIPIIPLPGPSSIITALSAGGLPTSNFWFCGFLPKQKERIQKLLTQFAQQATLLPLTPTLIFFETPHRLLQSLEIFQAVFGDSDIVIARELTKQHEEIWKGKISDALTHFTEPKGEFLILFKC